MNTGHATMYALLADVLLILHAAYVGFVLFGLVVTWVGWWRGWAWVRHPGFRLAHLLAIGVVAAEALLGITCPLTVWEDHLRWMAGQGLRYQTTFIRHWLGPVLFYDCSAWVFTVSYVLFFLLVVASFIVIPPRRSKRRVE